MKNEKIWLSSPHMGGREATYVQEAFATNWVAPVGPQITDFENDLATYNSIGYCAALSSGTAAIHLALLVAGVSQGDEVLCSTFTFSGSCNPIRYVGATPVFIDSEMQTWNMDPDLLEEAILDRVKKTGKTPKAIILVHLYGMPAQVERIRSIASSHQITLIEDAAEALGSSVNKKKLGTFGDLGVFSFNGNKIITTSGGGALVSANEEYVKQVRYLATQARRPAPHYEHTEVGYNYRLSNVCAAIGRGQMHVLDSHIEKRRSNFSFYMRSLDSLSAFDFLAEPLESFSNRWLTTVTFRESTAPRNRDTLRVFLDAENIETRPLWKPMHLQPVFQGCPFYGSGVSEHLFNAGLCLPSGSNLTAEQLNRVVDQIRLFFV